MKDLSNDEHTTEKIPDWILLRKANTELGELKSYIQELEAEIARLKSISKSEKLKIKLSETFVAQRKQINEQQRTIHELRKTNEKLMNKTFIKLSGSGIILLIIGSTLLSPVSAIVWLIC